MRSAQYIGPRRGLVPALEQNILKFRAMQMMLILFYAEDLKGEIIDHVRANERVRKALGMDALDDKADGAPDEDPAKAEKKKLKRAFAVLVAKGIVTPEERAEILELLTFRNFVAHQLQNLTADISNERWARETHEYDRRAPKYDYEALKKIEKYRTLISERIFEKQWVMSARMESLVFNAAERVFKHELKRLSRIIDRQIELRNKESAAVRAEMDLSETELVGEFAPGHPLSHYDNGRLTKRGEEICYRLFDLGKSTLAVAYLIHISLDAARHRKKLWRLGGGRNRPHVDLASIPRRIFYARYED